MTDKSNTDKETDHFCEACVFDKHSRKPFNDSNTRAKEAGTLLHFDICSPMSIKSFGGTSYMALFVDDYTGMIFVYTMKSKADIVDCMKDVIAEANAAGHKIRYIRSDNAKEFIGQEIKKVLQKHESTSKILERSNISKTNFF